MTAPSKAAWDAVFAGNAVDRDQIRARIERAEKRLLDHRRPQLSKPPAAKVGLRWVWKVVDDRDESVVAHGWGLTQKAANRRSLRAYTAAWATEMAAIKAEKEAEK